MVVLVALGGYKLLELSETTVRSHERGTMVIQVQVQPKEIKELKR